MRRERIRIGVIGVGFGAKVQIPGFQDEGFEVVAVCARRRESAEEAAKSLGVPHVYTDYRDMLARPDLDAVSIVTPTVLHHEITMAALEAGKHVLCEKPFAMNQQQAREMLQKAQQTGLTAMVTHEFRFTPGRAYVKELLQQGFIGELRNASVTLALGGGRNRTREAGPLPWRSFYSQGGGDLAGIGSHYIDCLRDWFGEIKEVCGRAFADGTVAKTNSNVSGGDSDDSFSFLVTFAKGGWASMSANFAAPVASGVRIEIHGTDGTLVTPQPGGNPPPDGIVLAGKRGDKQLRELPTPDRFRLLPDDRDARLSAFRILVQRFRQGISEGTSPEPNFYDGYRCQQIIDAVMESGQSGRWIEIR
jgi:predicted dehydrogenase